MKYVIELNFRNGVRFGSDVANYGVEAVQGFAHSDTIFSGLINTLAETRHCYQHHDWVNKFFDVDDGESVEPPFRLSSFGFVDTKPPDHRYYLPKPCLLPPKILPGQMNIYGKKYKRLQYIALDIFKKWQVGEILDLREIVAPDNHRQSFWVEEPKTQHVTDSVTLAAQIFRTGLVFYDIHIKPFFLLDLDETQFSFQEFKMLLAALQFNGLGGRRTTGCGAFEFTDEDWFCIDAASIEEMEKLNEAFSISKEIGFRNFQELFQHTPQSYYLFSTYFPQNPAGDQPLAYELVQRKGWFHSTMSYTQLKRKSCFMYSEGSIFKTMPAGKLVNVTPAEFTDHQIYRCGIPFTIPFGEA